MRLPRDLSGDELIKISHRFGYQPVRQTGSHVRMSLVSEDREHHITIPTLPNRPPGLIHQFLCRNWHCPTFALNTARGVACRPRPWTSRDTASGSGQVQAGGSVLPHYLGQRPAVVRRRRVHLTAHYADANAPLLWCAFGAV